MRSRRRTTTRTTLCEQADGEDRWYLETLRIAGGGVEDRIFTALRTKYRGWDSKIADLYWVLQAPSSVGYLTRIAGNRSLPLEQRLDRLLERLGQYPRLIATAKKNLKHVPPEWIPIALDIARGNLTFIEDSVHTALQRQGLHELTPASRARWRDGSARWISAATG